MGYYLSEPAPSKSDPTAKNRVWGFFAESVSESLEARRAVLETHRENYGESRKTASGIPLWLSRDPIGERGDVNLYTFVGNDMINKADYLGLIIVDVNPADNEPGYEIDRNTKNKGPGGTSFKGSTFSCSCECPKDYNPEQHWQLKCVADLTAKIFVYPN
ncbi:hypothetical protein ACFQY0_19090 [Haloferula chungangensis]|uniref:Uncharacterized protein n=1 Tax=Haloferula chungangensis TaxID=1048331 RepID=A0ABW2LET8_9BACT